MKTVGKGTVEARGKGKFRLRVSVTYNDGSSKRLYNNVECRTKTEAKRLLDQWRMELLQDNVDYRRNDITVYQYLSEYLEYCKTEEGLSPSTIRGYRDIIDNRIKEKLGDIPLNELRPYMIEEHYSYLRRQGGRNGGPLSGSTCQKVHSFLKTALKRAVILEYIPTNPCDRIKGPTARKPKTNSLTAEEAHRMSTLLRGHPDRRFAIAATIALATGMRRGEVCGLTWNDVDLDKGLIWVRKAVVVLTKKEYPDEKNRLRIKDTKTDSSERCIAIDEKTVEALKRHKEDQFYTLAYFGEQQTPDTPVASDQFANYYSPDHFTKAFESFRAQHHFDIRLHDLRHTQATILLEQRVPIATVSKRLGHAKTSTTLDLYSHVLPGQDEKAAETIGELFFSETA